jgi:large repetitive protein
VFLEWARRRKVQLVTATSGFVVLTVLATIAVVSTGYAAQRMDLNDASVWVANDAKQFVGRANTAINELNSVVPSGSNDVEIIQAGSTVLVAELSDAKLDIVDAATSSVLDTIALPPDQPQVFLAGENVVIYSRGTGELWLQSCESLSRFDVEQAPALTLGARSVVSVDDTGVFFAFSFEAKQVYWVDVARAAVIQ